jgi:DNA polymerase III delta' subunit
VDGLRTRGQPAAAAAVAAMIRGSAPHAVLFVGPDGVGKTTLAVDLAAGLLCTADPADRPCRTCRACRLVEHGSHPDLHRLEPTGPGRQVVIGGPGARSRGVRDLIAALSLMPVEGGARVAIVEGAERMNEDAQSALLKVLEEPPAGVTIVLCADGESRLLPTVRSRCARVRLGLVGSRDIEAIVADHGLADPPTAARLGRLAGGRPGLALAYARAPEAVLIRAELARVLLDLTDARPSARLVAARAAVPRALALAAALEPGGGDAAPGGRPTRRRSAPGTRPVATAPPPSATDADLEAPASTEGPDPDEPGPADEGPAGPRAVPATERRRAVERLLALWLEVARDLALVASGGARSIRDTVLLEELAGIAASIPDGSVQAFLERGARAAELLAANVSPELILDSLVLAWPRRTAAA